jgi:hypothetical protein
MLNPWFCALALDAAVRGYEEKAGRPMPLSLAFLVLPLVLHGETARSMPKSSTAKFANWALDNPRPLAVFPHRAREMTSFSREALLLGTRTRTLTLDAEGLKSAKNLKPVATKTNAVLGDMVTLARLLGIMLAQAGPPSTVYALLGVAP